MNQGITGLDWPIRAHWLSRARRVLSPNCDERPDPADISLIVVHCISLPPGEFEGQWVEDFFCNRLAIQAHPFFSEIADLKVSSHVYIARDGGVVQFVPFHRRAWHAGESVFEGRAACNDFSVGIELAGEDNTPYTSAQYVVLARVIAALQAQYPATALHPVVGHCDIA
ncbi:MAG: 1,6-anhydro-N-acetylmuramyl-L-alanine amidase AmpD, partial [Gammaproteobacteria bacterium]